MTYRSIITALKRMLERLFCWLNDFFDKSDSSRPMQMLEIRHDGKKTVRNFKQEPEARLLKLVFLWTLFFLFLLAAFNIASAKSILTPSLTGLSAS